MLKLYTSPSCTSCRKARAWLIEHEIAFEERNMMSNPLNVVELREILTRTESGTDELISTRSKAYASLEIDLNDLSINELLNLLESNPALVRRPLIMDKTHLQIGYNEDEIRCFLPRNVRKLELRKAQVMSGFK
jgi:regulatory protein spx